MKNYTYMNKKNINYFKRKSSDQIIIIEQDNQEDKENQEKVNHVLHYY